MTNRKRRQRGEEERVAMRRQQVMNLRRDGFSYRQIAAQVKVSHETVREDIQSELSRLAKETSIDSEGLRALELSRLDMATRGLVDRVMRGEIDAIQAWNNTINLRAKLLGLFPARPIKVEWAIPAEVIAALEGYGVRPSDLFEAFMQEVAHAHG